MCGRCTLHESPKGVADYFRLRVGSDFLPRYNVAPSQPVVAVRQGAQGRELVMLRWGLIPSWAKDPKIGYGLINARAETVADKPTVVPRPVTAAGMMGRRAPAPGLLSPVGRRPDTSRPHWRRPCA